MIDHPIRDLRESWAHFVASDCDGGFADLHDAVEVILDDELLYAAAPLMLATLKRLVSDPDLDDAEAVRIIEAAIAAAEGRA